MIATWLAISAPDDFNEHVGPFRMTILAVASLALDVLIWAALLKYVLS